MIQIYLKSKSLFFNKRKIIIGLLISISCVALIVGLVLGLKLRSSTGSDTISTKNPGI